MGPDEITSMGTPITVNTACGPPVSEPDGIVSGEDVYFEHECEERTEGRVATLQKLGTPDDSFAVTEINVMMGNFQNLDQTFICNYNIFFP